MAREQSGLVKLERERAGSNGTSLVSVVMIFLNGEKFIDDAIASVFAQTYHAWELLLVDDGSTDGSTAIARTHAQRRPERVRYLQHEHHKNRGMSASRNLGIAHARGSLVAFLDADDVWLPAKLEEQVALLESHPSAAMVYGPAQRWYSWTGAGEDLHKDFVPAIEGGPVNAVVEPPRLLPLLLPNECVEPFASGIMVRRAALEKVHGFEARFRGMYEDLVVFAKLSIHEPVLVTDRCWHRYRQSSESCTSVTINTGRLNSAWVIFLEWLAAYLWRHEVWDENVWAHVRSDLGPYPHPAIYPYVKPVWHLGRRVKKWVRARSQH